MGIEAEVISKKHGDVVNLTPELQKFLETSRKAVKEKGSLTVGLHRDAQGYNSSGGALAGDETTNVVAVGFWNELGTKTIPARYWLRNSIREDEAEHKAILVKIYKTLPKAPKTYATMMREFGRKATRSIQDHVESNDIGMPANAPGTQRQKGGDQPMVDTGHLVRQIDWKFYEG